MATRPPQLGVKSIQRIGRVVQEFEGAPLQNSHRRGRWPIVAGGKAKAYVVITPNCALDGFELAVGTTTDPDGQKYVEAKRVQLTATGAIENGDPFDDDDSAATVKLYCDTVTRGFLCHGLVVEAVQLSGRLRARTGALTIASGRIDSGNVDMFADRLPESDVNVIVTTVGTLCSDGPETDTQRVWVTWEWVPTETAGGHIVGTAWLRISDWCCPE